MSILQQVKHSISVSLTQHNDIINTLNTQLNQIDAVIYQLCQHNWIIDNNRCDEHPVYVCDKCFLLRNNKYINI